MLLEYPTVERELFELNTQDPTVKPLATSFNSTEDHLNPDISDESVLGFRVGNLRFLLAANIFCEIVDQNKVSPLPNVQPWFSGVLNLRGDIVPIIDLHILLADGSTPLKNRHLLAIDKGKKTVAFWIDGYPQMLSPHFTSASAPDDLPDVLRQAITDYSRQDQHLWLTLSLDKLFKALSVHTVQDKD
ncbi:hypothetical protein CRENPOLYSF1_550023 [Crenothrix polyspora]|uniref:CheW-like domain-containing protein n=1 Tax=Crenothrix polyspora TaxID=360316 RepID=A0A1R4HEA8_9GAMM|nr:hypothetical protein CRENPOLYSF1_550023 [Crenothrix polyspora]